MLKTLLSALVVLACLSAASADYCPTNWFAVGDLCYRRYVPNIEGVGHAGRTWSMAKKDCESRNSTLMAGFNETTFPLVSKAPFEGRFWTGMKTSIITILDQDEVQVPLHFFRWLNEYGVVLQNDRWFTGNECTPPTDGADPTDETCSTSHLSKEGCVIMDVATQTLSVEDCDVVRYGWYCQAPKMPGYAPMKTTYADSPTEKSYTTNAYYKEASHEGTYEKRNKYDSNRERSSYERQTTSYERKTPSYKRTEAKREYTPSKYERYPARETYKRTEAKREYTPSKYERRPVEKYNNYRTERY